MMAPLERLIESLRNELQQYGEILALLDQQHKAVLYQGADDVLHSIAAINAQSSLIQKARRIRRESTQGLCRSLDLAPDTPMLQLIPSLPDHYRPLLTALVQENNALLVDVRKRAERNHSLLRRSVDLMQLVIDNMSTADTTLIPIDAVTQHPASTEAGLYEAIA